MISDKDKLDRLPKLEMPTFVGPINYMETLYGNVEYKILCLNCGRLNTWVKIGVFEVWTCEECMLGIETLHAVEVSESFCAEG